MKLGINLSAVVSALTIMAVISLLIMLFLTRLDYIVNSVLYNFGLRFSYRWAMPYWTNSSIIIGLSWFNIAASFILIYYIFKRRKCSPSFVAKQTENIKEQAEELVDRPEKLIETQILDQYCALLEPRIESYDVKHPKEVIDSQC